MELPFEVWLALGAALVGLYYFLTKDHDYWSKRGIKYEKPAIFFGNLTDAVFMKRSQGQIMTDIYKKFENEKVVGVFNFGYPALVIRDPELVNKIYVTDFNYFANNEIEVDENVDWVLAKNMFAQKGEKWKRTRQAVSPAFAPSKIKAYFDGMIAVGEKLNAYVSQHPEELNLKNTMALYTSEIVASCGLGIDGQSFSSSDPQLFKMGQLIFQPGITRGITQMIIFLLPSLSKMFNIKMIPNEVPDYFNVILRHVIEHRQENYDEKRNDMLQHWIELKRKSIEVMKGNIKSDVITKEFTDDDILGGCITFFIESFETSSMLSSWALYHLAMNEDIQDRLREEIDETLKANNGKLTFEALINMPLLHNIVQEVTRLHPPILNSSKSCTKRYAMDIGKNEPLVIEEGTTLILPTFGLNTDPKFWDNPNKFDPDRFKDDDKSKRQKGVFVPFGDGPRVCVGVRLGQTLIKVGLLSILKDYKVVRSPRTPEKYIQDPTHFMSSQKGGMYGKFVKRS